MVESGEEILLRFWASVPWGWLSRVSICGWEPAACLRRRFFQLVWTGYLRGVAICLTGCLSCLANFQKGPWRGKSYLLCHYLALPW